MFSFKRWLLDFKRSWSDSRFMPNRNRVRRFIPHCEQLEDRNCPATFVVSNIAATGAGSLEQAILDANATANVGGPDLIQFQISQAVEFINVGQNGLSAITDAVTIDGRAPVGYEGQSIRISGVNAGAGVNGLTVDPDAGGTTIRSLTIVSFPGDGILINGAVAPIDALLNNIIMGDYIGTDSMATPGLGNGGNGVEIIDSSRNLVGTPSYPELRNVISGNGKYGVLITTTKNGNATENRVQGDFIGTNFSGAVPLPNDGGVQIAGTSNNNMIGQVGIPNVISGNTENGVLIASTAKQNRIVGNMIGVSVGGDAAVPNAEGVAIFSDGESNSVENNIISGNEDAGIWIKPQTAGLDGKNTVVGNFIGTDYSGNFAIPNGTGVPVGAGIRVSGSNDNIIGGASQGERNIISGNTGNGISLVDSRTRIHGNYVGTTVGGAGPLGNTRQGIQIYGDCDDSLVGGKGQGEGNVVSGNFRNGIRLINSDAGFELLHTLNGVEIYGNLIGMQADGVLALWNGRDGISVEGADDTIIGSSGSGGNTIFSRRNGISVDSDNVGTSALLTSIRGNYIGVRSSGIGSAAWIFGPGTGIYVGDAHDTLIGVEQVGGQAGQANVIADQTVLGIMVETSALRTIVRGNVFGKDTGGNPLPNGRNIKDRGRNTLIASNALGPNVMASVTLENATGTLLVNNEITESQGDGIQVNASAGVLIQNNYIGTDASLALGLGNAGAAVIVTDATSSVSMQQNVIAYNGGDGIRVTNCAAVEANDNSIHDNGAAGVDLFGGTNITLATNTITNNQTAGLVVYVGVTDVIQDNTITQNAGVDMQFLGGQTTALGALGVAGTVQQTGGLLDIQGTLTALSDYNLSGGTLSVGTLNDNGNLEQSGGTLTGPGTAFIAGALTWTGGAMTGAGTTVVLPGGVLTVSDSESLYDRTLLNKGIGTWTSDISGANGMFRNAASGTLYGTGTLVGRLLNEGNLFPGGAANAGAIAVNGTYAENGTYTENGTLQFDLGALGSASDLISASTVNLSTVNPSATLQLNPIGTPLADSYTIINNTGGSAVNGRFAGLPEGTIIILQGKRYWISYFGGDGNDVVLKTPATVTTLISSANPSTVGFNVTFTAGVSSSCTGGPFMTGTVTFFADGVALGSATISTVGHASFSTSSLSVGVHAMTAVYSGDGIYYGSTSAVLSQTVNRNSVIVMTNVPGSVAAGQTFTLEAAINGAGPIMPTGTVTFTLIDANGNETQLGSDTVNGSGHASITASVAMAGTYHIRVSYSGDANYFAASTTLDLNVYSAPPPLM